MRREAIERSVERVICTRCARSASAKCRAAPVGELVMEELRHLDEVAYVRFASVYRSFQDVTEFQQEIERLQSLPSLLESREQMSLLPGDGTKKPGPSK